MLSLSLTEIFSTIENIKKTFYYSRKQESAFVQKPELLAFFDSLLRGKSVKELSLKFSITDKKITQLLLDLDKLGLIDLYENNRIKILKEGEPIWTKNGPLARAFKKEIISDFLCNIKEKKTTFYIHDYLEEDMPKIEAKVKELKEFLAYSHKRAEKSFEKESYGIYLGMDKFSWDMDKYLK